MRKILSFLLITTLFLSGCGSADKDKKDATKDNNNTKVEKNKDSKKNINGKDIFVDLVIAISGIDDKSFNQYTWDGMLKFGKEFNVPDANFKYALSLKDEDFVKNLSNFSDQKPDIIVSPGYYFKDAVSIVSKKYPKQKYLIIDNIVENRDNVCSVVFNEEEASYIVGVIAGMKAKEEGYKKIGFLGGKDVPLIHKFEAGFEAGVYRVNKDVEIVIVYADDFSNPKKGKKLAKEMYDKGVKIIYNAAGDTGNGMIQEAVDRAKKGEDVWAIGVDKDQYEEGKYSKDKSVVITSAIKRLDVVTYNTLKLVAEGKFKSGLKVYNLKNKGVGLPNKNPNLKKSWLKKAKHYRKGIILGKVKVPLEPKRIKELKKKKNK